MCGNILLFVFSTCLSCKIWHGVNIVSVKCTIHYNKDINISSGCQSERSCDCVDKSLHPKMSRYSVKQLDENYRTLFCLYVMTYPFN